MEIYIETCLTMQVPDKGEVKNFTFMLDAAKPLALQIARLEQILPKGSNASAVSISYITEKIAPSEMWEKLNLFRSRLKNDTDFEIRYNSRSKKLIARTDYLISQIPQIAQDIQEGL
jgi:hypothetical protein